MEDSHRGAYTNLCDISFLCAFNYVNISWIAKSRHFVRQQNIQYCVCVCFFVTELETPLMPALWQLHQRVDQWSTFIRTDFRCPLSWMRAFLRAASSCKCVCTCVSHCYSHEAEPGSCRWAIDHVWPHLNLATRFRSDGENRVANRSVCLPTGGAFGLFNSGSSILNAFLNLIIL